MEMLDDPLAAGGPEPRAQRWLQHHSQEIRRKVVHVGAIVRDARHIEYDAVPGGKAGLLIKNGGTPSSTEAEQTTLVSPNEIRQETSACFK